MERRHRTMEFH
uniref:Uncharacterized protein n=1 Tax=Lepeophtheirus salmonis TaxID=72036 RepID=A0A0K2TIF7_LEPSM